MTEKLVRHGTQAGYKAEVQAGNVCDRCRNASRVYNSQYTPTGKRQGIKYKTDVVLDHLYKRNSAKNNNLRSKPSVPGPVSAQNPPRPPMPDYTGSDQDKPVTSFEEQQGSSLADRLAARLRSLGTQHPDQEYVEIDETPAYIHEGEPDPEPDSGEWSAPQNDEFLVTADGIKQIKDNLGTYMATVGMTLGLIDPYCGTAIRNNLDDVVDGWTRVISHYPTAAKMFMAKGGGKIMAWIDALMSTWPILVAIYEHHLSKTVKLDSLGNPVRVSKSESPNGQYSAQPNYNYTVD